MPQSTAQSVLKKTKLAFQAEGRLLQELGLRLVASPQVALVELIKNAYDADSPDCVVDVADDGSTLIVTDHGSGMTFDQFTERWMTIATSNKSRTDTSPRFNRPLTGAKGIGRFAVRYLGDELTLSSVAFDPKYRCMTQLQAHFKWPHLESASNLGDVKIPCVVTRAKSESTCGTSLRIRHLRSTTAFTTSPKLKSDILKIVSPIKGLESGRFVRQAGLADADPGFQVSLPGAGDDAVDLASLVLANAWARLLIDCSTSSVTFTVWRQGRKKPAELQIKHPHGISRGFVADIRYFPRRAGIFQNKGMDGKAAWTWVRANSGVKVVDHGFHIHPYGFPNDDWLELDLSTSHNERHWRSEISQAKFPIPPDIQKDPALNPALNLATNFQLVGAVFIETQRATPRSSMVDLIPAMDREGLIRNSAFADLRTIVRGGIEFLAHVDKAEMNKEAERQLQLQLENTKQEISDAIVHIRASETLTPGDKSRIVRQYLALAERVEEDEEYSEQQRRSLTAMNMLGVVAGYMTHESKAIIADLEEAAERIRQLSKKDKQLLQVAQDIDKRIDSLRGYLDYSRLYIQSVRHHSSVELSAAAQVRHVLRRFRGFAEDRGIELVVDIDKDVVTPQLPVTVYSGIILNLYTNALKAVLAARSRRESPKIAFRAWNEPKKHILEVVDNGPGIPTEIRKRIWDPLFTTTSDVSNPLGSGMGLGLTLIRQVATEFGGRVLLLDKAPPGFATCFRVIFPR